jgi:deoxyribodipyrimidine photo-lyase
VGGMPPPPVIAWLRRDLRARGNPVLAPCAGGAPLVPVVVLDDPDAGQWAAGSAGRWWRARSLEALNADLGGALRVLRGRAADLIPRLAAEMGAKTVRWGARPEPWRRASDAQIRTTLEARGVAVEESWGAHLFPPGRVLKDDGTPYRVFTPFYKACLERLELSPRRKPGPECSATLLDPGARRDDTPLLHNDITPFAPWHAKLARHWTPGERAGRAALAAWVDGPMADYKAARDRLDAPDATSRLSPHLAWGEVCPHDVLAAAWGRPGAEAFIRQLFWREFSAHLLWHFPDLPEKPLQPAFARFPWAPDARVLEAWQRGRTGQPLVDAAMAQLWETGVMHNRARMVVASFLTKNLLQPWQDGQAWFWDTLVDADLANNAAGWQWVAGCGADAAPYFRVFNPATQAAKFDPEGRYVARWAPALSPQPLVDLKESRARALAAYAQMKGAAL